MHNIVLIGCGHMGTAHLEDIYLREDICVYGVVDIMEEKARLTAKKYNAKSFSTDYIRYMEDENVDIIICATYPSTHLQILKDCVKYNKHLLCEKPITDNLEDGKEFVSIVKNTSIKVLIGYILRYNETYKKVAEMIEEGAIGGPIVLRMTQNNHTVEWEKYLALIKETSPIIDCGVHYIDVCRWFTGAEVIDVGGISLTTEKDVPKGKYNYGMITMKLSDGSVAYYEAGWGKTVAADNTKEFIGPKGRIKIVQSHNRFFNKEEGDLIEYYNVENKEYKIINVNCKRRPTGAELDNLINMIENNAPSNPSIEDVYKSFEIAIKADDIIRPDICF
ncbi:MAG TPA: Gfo/Idh/MocA family oxidoreductase [Clostridiales bacterium]|nr:Gfo/Idh/MocA family oxidoreductase [Clostridiales bacterium]